MLVIQSALGYEKKTKEKKRENSHRNSGCNTISDITIGSNFINVVLLQPFFSLQYYAWRIRSSFVHTEYIFTERSLLPKDLSLGAGDIEEPLE